MSLSFVTLGVGDAFSALYYSSCLAVEAEGQVLLDGVDVRELDTGYASHSDRVERRHLDRRLRPLRRVPLRRLRARGPARRLRSLPLRPHGPGF